jgi:hypothetical protein
LRLDFNPSSTMKSSLDFLRPLPQLRLWLVLLALAAGLTGARAGVTIQIQIYNYDNYYFVQPWLSGNSIAPLCPVGIYTVSPPNFPASGTAMQFQSTDGLSLNYLTSIINSPDFTDLPSTMAAITNGHWTLQITNAASTNTYTFTVSAPPLPADTLAAAIISFPIEGTTYVPALPDFTWQGPPNWEGTLIVDDVTNDSLGNGYLQASASLPPAQTNWTPAVRLPNGTNQLEVAYSSNASSIIVASMPLDPLSNPLLSQPSSWVSTALMETWGLSEFSVTAAPAPAGGQQGHTLIAQYPFNQATYGWFSADDVSGNNNGFYNGSSWANSGQTQYSPNGINGDGSLQLDGGECINMDSPPGNQTFDNWLATFYGSFSISLWLDTSSVVGNDNDNLNGNNGASIIWAYNNGVNDTIPIALTGTKVAFFTGDPSGQHGDTLHSAASVTTGSFVHVVVTRDQATGQKAIYINGALDASDVGTTDPLDGNTSFYSIGGYWSSSYSGLLDDVQIYTGVLNSNEVAFLYANPGTPMTNVAGASSGLVAYCDFDEYTEFAADLSANGNNLVYGGRFSGPALTNDSISGKGAVYFDGGSFLTPSTNLLATLASNFSLSLWVKTTQSFAYDGWQASYGAGIVAADVYNTTNSLIPMALTGGEIGFNTGTDSSADTINSTADINNGAYHHLVVTRDQATGTRQIYIDGVLNTNNAAAPGLLAAPQLITIGALADASNPDPTSPEWSGYNGFVGLMDDIQFYSRVLTPAEVAGLHASPGSSVTSGLVAHYDFDEGTVLAADVSGNGNNMLFAGRLKYNVPGPAITTDAESGPGALSFDGLSYLVPEGNLLSTLSSNFSLSVWLQTTQSLGNPGDAAANGAGIVTAEVPGQSFDLVPLALTGGKIAFGTDGFGADTLTSETRINDGNYHHVVVTRNQGTGEKQIYIDGALNTADISDTAFLNYPNIVIFGAMADASQSDPYSPALNASNGYVGLMDSVQIYSRVISPAEVTFLYDNPGAAIPVPAAANSSFGAALGAPDLLWSTGGDADWFIETTNTWSSDDDAVQSGSVTLAQSSTISTTLTGPGTLTFYWSSIANDPNGGFYCECYYDGEPNYNNLDGISGDTYWFQDGPFDIPAGQHTLEWTAYANGDTDPTQAAFLDQVSYIQDTVPVITLNPFNQTNYPGYSVALVAAATGIPAPTWQWYEVGNPNPIPGATSALFIPANSGQSSVAGSYYAVASTPAGSQTTTTALVTFVSAPLPPDWSEAFKSPFVNYDNDGNFYVANDMYWACTVDSTGANIFSAGSSDGTNFFGTNEILNEYTEFSAVIVKQTAAKATAWVVSITNNGNGNAYAEEIAPAPGGGVYAAGNFSGTNWLGKTLLEDSGEGTYFLAQFDANGNTVWIQTVSNSFPFLNGLAADPAGNVTAVVQAGGSTTLGGSNLAGGGTYLAQFSPGGTLNWVEQVPEAIFYLQYSAGRIYASLANDGNTNSAIGGLTNNTDRNWTVAAINATNGQGIWLRGVGEGVGISNPEGLADDYPEIAVSGTNVFLVGTAYGSSAVFGSFTVPIAEGRGQYFARYDTNGNAQLAAGFGSPTTQPQAAVADASGNVYVAGNFDTYAFFGNEVLAAPRLNTLTNSYYGHAGYFGQAFAAEFDRTGAAQWARMAESTNLTVEGTDMVNFYDIALASNAVWVCGFGNAAVWFGTNVVNSSGEFVVLGSGGGIVPFYYECFNSGMLGMIAVTPSAEPVTLLDPAVAGGNFQFQFLSQEGFTHNILCQTNVAAGQWLTNSTVTGDGTMKSISVPLSVFAPSKSGFVRVSTQ